MVSGSGISWAICKSAPSSRQITVPAPHHSGFYRPDALPAAQPTVSKHWRHVLSHEGWKKWVNPGNTVRVLSLWWRLYVTLSLVIITSAHDGSRSSDLPHCVRFAITGQILLLSYNWDQCSVCVVNRAWEQCRLHELSMLSPQPSHLQSVLRCHHACHL